MSSEFCSLCVAICDNLSKKIEEDTRELLVELLQHFDIKTRNDPKVVCTNCSTRLRGYLEFKSSFLKAQARVQSFDTKLSDSLLDVTQVYLHNKGNASEVSTKGLVVCRFCLKQTTGAYTALVEDQKALILVTIMMRKCFPGLELGTLSGCVICKPCHEALEASYNLITSWDAESYVKNEEVEDMEFVDGLDLKPVLHETGFGCVDLSAVKKEDSYMANGADFERVEVKVETVQTDFSRSQGKYDGSEKVIEVKEDVDVEEHSLSPFEDYVYDVKMEQAKNERVKRKASATQSSHDSSATQMYKCNSCPYEAELKKNLNRHILVHKKPSEVPIYKCQICKFQTRYSRNLRNHELIHKKSSEVQMYKCETCPYETKRKKNYDRHVFIHKNASNTTMYKCASCDYESCYKKNLQMHLSIHSKPSEVMLFKCELCIFRTKHPRSFRRHKLIHKDEVKQVRRFTCDACEYQTNYKNRLKKHMLVHQRADKGKVTRRNVK